MARKSSNKTWWIVGGVVVALALFLFIARQAGWIGKEKPVEVEVAKVQKRNIVEMVSATGKVQPEVEVKLSPDVSGEIIELNVEEGDSVKKGQILVKIRPDNYLSQVAISLASVNTNKAQLEQAKAAEAQAEARFVRAKANFDRNQKLLSDSVISPSDFEQIKSDYDVASKDIESAKSNVQAAEFNIKGAQASLSNASENLRKTTIAAPASGVISLLNVEVGERVLGTTQMAGTELMRIANLANMEVRVNVNENDIVRVQLGDTADIDVDAYSITGRKFKGIVREIANTANGLATSSSSSSGLASSATDAVTEFEVRVSISKASFADLMATRSKKSYPFKPGMTASVDIITDRKNNVLSVPIASVTTRDSLGNNNTSTSESDGSESEQQNENDKDQDDANSEKQQVKELVFVINNGKAATKEVKTGISDFENIEVTSGLKEGDEVISGPFIAVSKRLKDGMAVSKASAESKNLAEKSDEKPE